MCGRMACALNKASLLHACQYQDDTGRFCNPKWVDLNSHGEYRPSYNISPRNYHPVMLSSVHVPKGARGRTGHRIMMSPMRWGLVPSWFSGEPQNFIFNTVNCRLESCMDRRSFKGAIAAERRCVVVAEGFFEWKTEENGDKQPYYVYFKQPRGVDMMKREWDHVTDAHQLMHNGHWIGPRLLTMAGIFDVSTSKDVLYSYTILTMDAPRYMQWLHNRVPLILDGDEAVASWLDPTYSFEELTYSVRCPPNLVCHPVSPGVAKVTNNTVECVLPYHSGESPVKTTPKKRTSKSPVKTVKKAHRSRSRSTVRSASFHSFRSSSSERSRRRSHSRNASAHRRSKTRHRAASDSSERHQRKRSHRRSDSHRHGRTN
ncbi:abasic site processing protein HMCES-like [Rhipicephalus microplus]|uniref:abasic site processing protein HMCES-like n=1 Tax=Rhipicephalus microplus TaxID=6941 RepID=UPI002376970B